MSADVEITLAGETVALRCTLDASRKISDQFGGSGAAWRGIDQFDINAFVLVIAAVTGKKTKDVENDVFATGMEALAKPLKRYLQRLSNGGREPILLTDDDNQRVSDAALKLVADLSGSENVPPSLLPMVIEVAAAVRPLFAQPAASDARGNG